ncbi:MAG: hypothetical protein M3Q87_06490 [Actinomycetota bacterium]|nr:hypothetical protein [Actinomycetota bacterium]
MTDARLPPPEAPARPIGFGILATGGIAASFVTDLAHAPGAGAVAVGSRRLERAQAFAGEHDIGAAYGS